MPLPVEKIFSPKVFRDIDEPMICGNNAVFIQNSYNCCKITVTNIKTGKAKSVTMKGIICFNAHNDDNSVAYEFSGKKRGIGVLNVNRLEIKEFEITGTDIILGGIWRNSIIIKRDHEIVLYDIGKNSEKVLSSYHHIIGTPVAGGGNCAWLQSYKNKHYITIYNIGTGYRLTFVPLGHVNSMYVFEDQIAFQSCIGNRCCVFVYNISSGDFTKCFESHNWVELYRGRDNMLLWTVRKIDQGQYTFDVLVYDIYTERIVKVLYDYKSALIPTASSETLIWVESGAGGDNLYRACMNLQ